MDQALNANDITKIGVGVIVILVVLGLLLGLIITALIGRVILAVVVIVLAVIVWQQRTSIQHRIDQRKCDFSFFGVHLDPPDSLTKSGVCKT
jgi:FlaA1/EpsC-like NDP-sugar epimerase